MYVHRHANISEANAEISDHGRSVIMPAATTVFAPRSLGNFDVKKK
jgi:hypothetical protein